MKVHTNLHVKKAQIPLTPMRNFTMGISGSREELLVVDTTPGLRFKIDSDLI